MKRFIVNRKMLYFVFSVVLVFIFTLTVVYAALNTILEITGTAEVVASNWDIYLDNVQLVGGSVTSDIPVITDKTTATFSTTLKNPGDFYMFTVDVVNNGSIDAMIDSVEKMPTLSDTQTKYLNYIIEYQNGESISTKQLVKVNSFVRLKVKISLRNDVLSTDLPDKAETLDLSFKVNYVQSDDNDSNVSINNNGKLVKVVSGNYDTTGSEICIGKECFYVISSTENDVTMLAKYNLLVGNIWYGDNVKEPLANPTGIQDASAIGYFYGYTSENPLIATKPFSSTNYWSSTVSTYPSYVYNKNSYLYEYIGNYKSYLENLGSTISEIRLISIEELELLGCDTSSSSCTSAPSWVYLTSYWTGSAFTSSHIWYVYSTGILNYYKCSGDGLGVRPVIVIPRNLL